MVNADAIVHELLLYDSDLGQKIIRLLGQQIIVDGKLSRSRIANIVFKDPEILHALEELLHPAVLNKVEELYQKALDGHFTAFVVESPLLFEIGQDAQFDAIIAVVADESLARDRFRKSGKSGDEYERRMKRQINPQEKALRADYVIINNGSLETLRQKVIELNKRLTV